MITPMDPMHFELIKPQARQAGAELSIEHARKLIAGGTAKACLNAKGETIACAGLVQLWPGRALAWAVLGGRIGHHMPSIVRAMRAAIDGCPYHRVEMYLVADRNSADIRLASLLGFRFEVRAERALPDGQDADVYIWTRPKSQVKLLPPSVPPRLCSAEAVRT